MFLYLITLLGAIIPIFFRIIMRIYFRHLKEFTSIYQLYLTPYHILQIFV